MERADVLVVEDKQSAGDALISSSSFFLSFFFVLFFFFLYLTHGQKMLEGLPGCMGVGVLQPPAPMLHQPLFRLPNFFSSFENFEYSNLKS